MSPDKGAYRLINVAAIHAAALVADHHVAVRVQTLHLHDAVSPAVLPASRDGQLCIRVSVYGIVADRRAVYVYPQCRSEISAISI